MKLFIYFIFLINIFQIINCQLPKTLRWINTTSNLDFVDPNGWDLYVVPDINDNTIIGINNIIVKSITENGIEVNSILIENGATLLSASYLDVYQNITIMSSELYFVHMKSNLVQINDSNLIGLIGVSVIESSNIKLYGDSIYSNWAGCNRNQCTMGQLNTLFTFYENSKLILDNVYSILGNFTFRDNSNSDIKNSTFYIDEYLNLNENSKITIREDSLVVLFGEVSMNNNSILQLKDGGSLMANNTFQMFDESSIEISNKSFVHVGALCKISNAAIIGESNIQSIGNLIINGDYFNFKDSFLHVLNGHLSFNSTNATIDDSTINVMGGGDVSIFKQLNGNNTFIRIDGGNLVANDNSNIKIVSSRVTLASGGQLLISPTSTLNLQGTIIENLNGTLITIGDLHLSSNSNILNKNQFFLSSNIYELTETSSINNNEGGSIFIDINKKDDQNNDDSSLKLGVKIINSGTININSLEKAKKIQLLKFTQSSDNSNTIVGNGTIINSNQTIEINGGRLIGNGTFNSSMEHTNGVIGSLNQTNQFNITNDYNQSENATILILINSFEEFSKIDIKKSAYLKGNIEIKISNKLMKENYNQQIDIINYNNEMYNNIVNSNNSLVSSIGSSSSSVNNVNFKNIVFKSYDPETGKEEPIEQNDCVQSKTSGKSFSVLFGSCSNDSNSKSKLSGGQIAGIVIGCVAFVIIVISFIHFRSRISLKVRHSKFSMKMKSRK